MVAITSVTQTYSKNKVDRIREIINENLTERKMSTIRSNKQTSSSPLTPSITTSSTVSLTSTKSSTSSETKSESTINPPIEATQVIVWRNVFAFVILHSSLVYGLFKLFTNPPWLTMAYAFVFGTFSGLGITAGAHRLWSHRAYKAKLPLRIFLAILQTVCGQNNIYEWCRDHRVHHTYSETDADPHNANRGFFFAHMGWLCVKKHPDVINKGRLVDCSDLLEDPVVRFQKNYFLPLAFLCCIIVPSAIPIICWNESFWNAFMLAGLARYCISLHLTWLVNSVAHLWGNRPYDVTIGARENKYVIIGAIGEGFHNYHHTFPWDYSTSELGWRWNLTTCFINTMAMIGQAYDLKTAPVKMIDARIRRTGNFKEHYSSHGNSVMSTL